MSIVNNLIDKISEFIRLKGESLKLDIITQASKLLAQFIVISLVSIIFLFLLVFLSLALSAYFNMLLESVYLGYLIVAGIYVLLLFGVIILLRSNVLQTWLEQMFMAITEKEQEDE
jgi:hypothetical protein